MGDLKERPVGLTKDVGFQVGARRTLSIGLDDAWNLLFSPRGLRTWLQTTSGLDLVKGKVFELSSGVRGEVRVFRPGSHIRLTWQPHGWKEASTIQVRVISSGERTVIAFHQENLPDSESRAERKRFFQRALDEFEALIARDS